MNVQIGTFNLSDLFDQFNFEADLGALPAEDRDTQTTYQWVFVGQGAGPDDPPPQLDGPWFLDTGGADPKGAHCELIVVARDPVEVTAADIPAGADERIKHGNKVILARSQLPARCTGMQDGSPVYVEVGDGRRRLDHQHCGYGHHRAGAGWQLSAQV